MTTSYGITGIGNYGLGSPGLYGNYDNYMPSMMGMYGMGNMGMNSSIFGGMNGMYGAGGMGMMGMYNPTFMASLQNQMEMNQLDHAANMHTKISNYGVQANRETDSALMQKILTNGHIKQGINNLYYKVKAGDQDGICKEFGELKNEILTTYKDEIAARGLKTNPETAATEYIEMAYGNIVNAIAGDGQTHDLQSDIIKYGEGALQNGFLQGFNHGHQQRYIDHTLNYIYGLPINDKGTQDMNQSIGKAAGIGASVLQKGAYGAAAGAALYTIGGGATKAIGKTFSAVPLVKSLGNIKFSAKTLGKAAVIGALVGTAADIIWKLTDNKATAKA